MFVYLECLIYDLRERDRLKERGLENLTLIFTMRISVFNAKDPCLNDRVYVVVGNNENRLW